MLGSMMKSTSPDSSAAVRVASDLIGVYTACVMLLGYWVLPHHCGLRLSTRRESCDQLSST